MSLVEMFRIEKMCAITGLGKSSIWARIKPETPQFDPDFPTPISLAANGRGAVAWRSDEVANWIERRTAISRQTASNIS